MTAEILAHWPMWASLAAVAITIVFYMLDRWSMELVSVSIIAALLVLFSLPGATAYDGSPISSADLLMGFANPALITIMALLVVGQGLFQTGALEGPTKALVRSYGKRPMLTLLAAFAAVFVTSAFTNNTPVVIMFLPIMSAIAARVRAMQVAWASATPGRAARRARSAASASCSAALDEVTSCAFRKVDAAGLKAPG